MSTMTLLHAVHTLDNRMLLPAGTVLSADTLDALISSDRTRSYQTHPVLQHGSVKEDLLHFLSEPPYQIIFADEKQLANVLNVTETVDVVLPVLQSLDYFKEYDFCTYRHILTVFALSTLLAGDLVSDYEDLTKGAGTGPTHDLGKACIPLGILKKSDPLTQTERKTLEHHSASGYIQLSYYLKDTQNLAATVARDHHERNDGSGYPRGVSLADLMVEIVAVSDVYDALTSPRPYRPIPYDNRTALEEVTRMAETDKIGWEVVKVLVAHNREDKPHHSECTVSVEKRGTPPPDNTYGVIVDAEGHAN
ncbi:MAG: HD domain-containing phosphohydrolase [Pseudomonadota bacterium]